MIQMRYLILAHALILTYALSGPSSLAVGLSDDFGITQLRSMGATNDTNLGSNRPTKIDVPRTRLAGANPAPGCSSVQIAAAYQDASQVNAYQGNSGNSQFNTTFVPPACAQYLVNNGWFVSCDPSTGHYICTAQAPANAKTQGQGSTSPAPTDKSRVLKGELKEGASDKSQKIPTTKTLKIKTPQNTAIMQIKTPQGNKKP